MVDLFNHLAADQQTELLKVRDKPGIGVRSSLDGDDEVEIMSVPVLVGTRSKDLRIFFLTP